MVKRDNIFIEEKINELIKINNLSIDELVEELEKLKQGINPYKRPIEKVIRSVQLDYSVCQKENMIATYTAGYSIERFKEEYLKYVDSLLPIWYSNSGYDAMLWALSIGILLEIDETTFDKLVDLVRKDDPEDYLIDYLIQSRHPEWTIRINYNFPRPYGFTRKIIEEENAEQALKLLKEYVTKKWYPGHRDTGWYDLHKENIDNYYGYWSFESGALCKLKGLDYKELEGVPYFPYDLVAEGAEV
ncbi:PoNe immunity protein domain-containing protein [Streptococcus sp. Marseille-P6264]|uniref:PoNe immunity protein domain-containing protein n=1 Tax=Streptococcus sp. Marseille-P6264 TaxID=2487315 RepID=UPI0037DA56EA